MQSINVFQLLEKSFQVGTVRNGAKVNSLSPDQTVRLRQRDAGFSAWDQNCVTEVKASLKLFHSTLLACKILSLAYFYFLFFALSCTRI